jgi:hypothetical protein
VTAIHRGFTCKSGPNPNDGYRGGGAFVEETVARVSGLLHEVAETHHRVFRITDGADDD